MITSLKNPRVAEALKLRKRGLRDDRRQFLVEGPQAVGEAVATGGVLTALFHTPSHAMHPVTVRARQTGVDVVEVGENVVAALASTVTPQGLVAVASFVDVSLEALPTDVTLAVVMFSIRDPGNAGTILRSADAAGADVVALSSESVDVYNPKVVRASAGSLFHLPVVRDARIDHTARAFRERGMTVYAASGRGTRELYSTDLTTPVAFVFGNEAWGVPDDVAALADATVRIPISERAESLNLAAAATVCLFEARRQRLPGAEVDRG